MIFHMTAFIDYVRIAGKSPLQLHEKPKVVIEKYSYTAQPHPDDKS